MATAQVVSATTPLHDEKPQEDINNTSDQETTVTEPQPQEKPADCTVVASEPELEPEAEPEPKPEPELEPVKALEVEVETKAVIKEEVSPVEEPAKAAPEPPCVEAEEAKETKEPEGTFEPENETSKPEPEPKSEPEEKNEEKEEVADE